MTFEENKYISLVENILKNGKPREDRTNTGTISLFGKYIDFDVSCDFPLLTSKRVYWKGVVEELLFFIRGDTDTKILERKGVNIWKGNTSRQFLDNKNLHNYPEGEMGPSYGRQWRNFGGKYEIPPSICQIRDGIDQLQNAIHLIRNDPYSRRILVSAWNPLWSDKMALDPCHYSYQFFVEPREKKLSILVNMRSCDVFLGLPFNIASYSLLLYIIAKMTDLMPSKVCFCLGDTHIYLNHIEQCKEQSLRDLKPFPTLKVIKKHDNINDYQIEDFILENYNPNPSIKATMAV